MPEGPHLWESDSSEDEERHPLRGWNLKQSRFWQGYLTAFKDRHPLASCATKSWRFLMNDIPDRSRRFAVAFWFSSKVAKLRPDVSGRYHGGNNGEEVC